VAGDVGGEGWLSVGSWLATGQRSETGEREKKKNRGGEGWVVGQEGKGSRETGEWFGQWNAFNLV